MELLKNLSQLSERGLLDLPNPPDPNYEIIQFPKEFVRVEDTEDVFGITKTLFADNEAANDDGIIAVSSGEWGPTFEKQIGRTSCGLAVALAYTRQSPIPASSMCPKFDGFNGSTISWIKKDGSLGSLKEDDLIKLVEENGAPNFKKEGLTIEQLRDLVLGGPNNFDIVRNVEGHETEIFKVNECIKEFPTTVTLAQFEETLKQQIEKFGGLILNYDMSTLGQVPGRGHFGIAVALAKRIVDKEETSFLLLLDPWPETPIAWVPVDLMFKATNTIDNTTARNRGCLVRKLDLQATHK